MKLKSLAQSCVLTCVFSALLLTGCASTGPLAAQGPGSSQTPYLLGENDWTTTALMNHELGSRAGVERAHGTKDSFVSEWRIDPKTMRILGGRDLIRKTVLKTGGNAFGRMCSADLPAVTAFYNPATGLGTQNRIFMNGEENGPTWRALAHVATGAEAGTTYGLTAMKQASWENVLANPFAQYRTVLIGLDDTHPKAKDGSKYKLEAGKLHVYIGHKQEVGNEIEKAGLLNGQSYAVRVGKGGLESRFDLVRDGGTNFLRPEDGRWDAKSPNVFYFLITDRLTSLKDADGEGDRVFTN